MTGIGLICEIAAEGGYESRLFRIGTVERISEQELGHRQRDDRRKRLLSHDRNRFDGYCEIHSYHHLIARSEDVELVYAVLFQ